MERLQPFDPNEPVAPSGSGLPFEAHGVSRSLSERSERLRPPSWGSLVLRIHNSNRFQKRRKKRKKRRKKKRKTGRSSPILGNNAILQTNGLFLFAILFCLYNFFYYCIGEIHVLIVNSYHFYFCFFACVIFELVCFFVCFSSVGPAV